MTISSVESILMTNFQLKTSVSIVEYLNNLATLNRYSSLIDYCKTKRHCTDLKTIS